MLFKKPIAIALSPNTSARDILRALSWLIFPWKWIRWRRGRRVGRLEKKFAEYLGVKHAFSFDSGRSGLYALLKCMGVGEGDEVILQAYTCVVVPNAVLFCGAKPIYVDVEKDTFNMDIRDLEKKITPKTKVIILQHTFGKPANIEGIMKIARKNKIRVLEDAAHALGSEYKGKKVGTFGDAAMWSFGRDKVISCVHGGMVTTDDERIRINLEELRQKLRYPSRRRIFQHLIHPVLFAFVVPLYNFFHLGKVFLVLAQKLRLVSKVFVKGEKQSKKPPLHPALLPNTLADLALLQLKKLDDLNYHRMILADFYEKGLERIKGLKLPSWIKEEKNIFMRYTLQVEKPKKLLNLAKQQQILLGDWYTVVIAPQDIDPTQTEYRRGSCPVAERLAKRTINLPTHHKIGFDEARKIIDMIRKNII